MNIGDKVRIELEMQVEGMTLDHFSREVLLTGRIRSKDGHVLFVNAPQMTATILEDNNGKPIIFAVDIAHEEAV